MNSVQKKQIVALQEEYIENTGVGQFTYYRFADWLMEEAPDLATTLVEEGLRQADKLMKEEEKG